MSGRAELLLGAETREEAERLAPWAAVILEVPGGWMAFESVADAARWEALGC